MNALFLQITNHHNFSFQKIKTKKFYWTIVHIKVMIYNLLK